MQHCVPGDLEGCSVGDRYRRVPQDSLCKRFMQKVVFLAGAVLCLLRGCEIDEALRQSALQVRFAEASCFMLGTNMELTI